LYELITDSSRSSSPLIIEDEQPMPISYSLSLKQNHLESNEDKNIPENDTVQQLTAVRKSFFVFMKRLNVEKQNLNVVLIFYII